MRLPPTVRTSIRSTLEIPVLDVSVVNKSAQTTHNTLASIGTQPAVRRVFNPESSEFANNGMVLNHTGLVTGDRVKYTTGLQW